MYKIICPNCTKENKFHSKSSTPAECSFCFASFDTSITVIEYIDDEREIAGLTIIYQIDQQRLEIPISQKIILGRENFGASILSKIFYNGKPVVSRKHCSIEYKDGLFYLLDEGSLNGTFYGLNKISCKNSPQVIENDSIFYIGQEPFLAKIKYKSPLEKDISENKKNEDDVSLLRLYRCNESGCGYESKEYMAICPNCNTYNSMVAVSE